MIHNCFCQKRLCIGLIQRKRNTSIYIYIYIYINIIIIFIVIRDYLCTENNIIIQKDVFFICTDT